MRFSPIRIWNWTVAHPKRALLLWGIVWLWIWTGQTYVWNPFFTIGYGYYPFLIFASAYVLGQLLPHRKRTKKHDLEHIVSEIKATPPLEAYSIGDGLHVNATTGIQLRPELDPAPPPPLESLRDDAEE